MVGIRNPSAPIVTSDLDEVENRFGFKFPQDVRDFYLATNGGRPEKDRFVYGDQMCTIHEFLPIKHRKKSLTLEATLLRVRSLLPDHLFPFAVDPGGDYFCFSTADADCGAIYFYRMDCHDPSRAARLLAPSLGRILGGLLAKDAAYKRLSEYGADSTAPGEQSC